MRILVLSSAHGPAISPLTRAAEILGRTAPLLTAVGHLPKQPRPAFADRPATQVTQAELSEADLILLDQPHAPPELIAALHGLNQAGYRGALLLNLPSPLTAAADPLIESSVNTLLRTGVPVIAHFSLSPDHPHGAGQRIVDFVEAASIPLVSLSLPDSPPDRLAREYVSAVWRLYDPDVFLDRAFRHHSASAAATRPAQSAPTRSVSRILWQQGIKHPTRLTFWRRLLQLRRLQPTAVPAYLSTCAMIEPLLRYREQARRQFEHILQRPHVEVSLPGLNLSSDRNHALQQS